ncbi:DNA primase, partial [Micromonospora aurantiaca]|nr:DNA primase [Micromonospora aurantiaca]
MAARWLAASTVLGRPVTDAEAYPHICGRLLPADHALNGRPVLLQRRDCAACAQGRHERRHP